jgi:hypothetical protein
VGRSAIADPPTGQIGPQLGRLLISFRISSSARMTSARSFWGMAGGCSEQDGRLRNSTPTGSTENTTSGWPASYPRSNASLSASRREHGLQPSLSLPHCLRQIDATAGVAPTRPCDSGRESTPHVDTPPLAARVHRLIVQPGQEAAAGATLGSCPTRPRAPPTNGLLDSSAGGCRRPTVPRRRRCRGPLVEPSPPAVAFADPFSPYPQKGAGVSR